MIPHSPGWFAAATAWLSTAGPGPCSPTESRLHLTRKREAAGAVQEQMTTPMSRPPPGVATNDLRSASALLTKRHLDSERTAPSLSCTVHSYSPYSIHYACPEACRCHQAALSPT